ncbi:MAG: glycosyltransferase family 4 protein [Pseudomonadota bacterium]
MTRRILLISPQPFFAWRGSPIRVKFNLLALEKLGYEVDFLTLPIGTDEPAINARVIRVWNLFGSKEISIGPSPLKLWFDLLLLIRGAGLVLTNKYDGVHGTEEAGFLCWMLSKLRAAKVIYEKHSDPGSYKKDKGGVLNTLLNAYRKIEIFTANRADVVIGTGPGLCEQVLEFKPDANVHHISDIPSSLSDPGPEEISACRNRLTLHDTSILVTYVGSFAIYQGIDLIQQAIPRVLSIDDRVQFVIIGGDEDEIAEFRTAIGEHPSERVTFTGKIPPDELPPYLSASDILMVPRKTGVNTPLKVLDYFKAGTAIVATDTIANRLLLDDSTAQLSQPNSEDFADCILKLTNDVERRKGLGSNGRNKFETEYNFDVFTKKLGNAYGSIFDNQ